MEEIRDTADIIKLSGVVENVIYSNEDNGFCICDISTDKNELVVIKGIMPMPGEGDCVTVYGKWIHDPKYGRQFAFEQYEKSIPSDAASMLRYLSSKTIKGIGPKTAKRIVDTFGDDTFDVIEHHPDWLSEIKGISVTKAYEISKDFTAKTGIRTAMMYFGDYFGPSLTVKIYKKWGNRAIEIVPKNPYILCEEIDGIGFEKADNMAQSIGFPQNSDERLKCGIVYILRYNTIQNGHTCLPGEKLVAAAAQMLGATVEKSEDIIKLLLKEKKICSVTYDDTKYIFDKYTYDCEKYIAEKLSTIDRLSINTNYEDVTPFLEKEESESGICYAALQRKAIADALLNGVMVLTGGPGTGKTTVVKALLHIFNDMGYKVALAAPTGRAAKRMSESTGCEAKTVHRLLEMSYSGDDSGSGRSSEYLRNENNLLDENVVIIDEASMIDVYLMNALLKAIKPGSKLILIGDVDQLPSVGAGDVLRDIINSNAFSVVRLNEIFRQAQMSLIVRNAHAINTGILPDLTVKNSDFFFILRDNDHDIALTVMDLWKNRLPRTYGKKIIDEIQVITPSRRGEAGTDSLNIILQEALNPQAPMKKEHKHKEVVYRQGDKVMQTRNNYDIEWSRADGSKGCGIFNGDIGIIDDIDRENQIMYIKFDERIVEYDFSMIEDLTEAYAITVHKSQGSEYPVVIIPIYNAPYMLLTRNLLYTAVTRASRMVILVGIPDIVKKMVENNRHTLRYTGLCRRLNNTIE